MGFKLDPAFGTPVAMQVPRSEGMGRLTVHVRPDEIVDENWCRERGLAPPEIWCLAWMEAGLFRRVSAVEATVEEPSGASSVSVTMEVTKSVPDTVDELMELVPPGSGITREAVTDLLALHGEDAVDALRVVLREEASKASAPSSVEPRPSPPPSPRIDVSALPKNLYTMTASELRKIVEAETAVLEARGVKVAKLSTKADFVRAIEKLRS